MEQDIRREAPKPKREDWLSPLNKIIWMNAFKARADSVTLRDGRVFVLTYFSRKQYNTDTQESEFVRAHLESYPTNIFYGDFLLSKVTDEEWLAEAGRQFGDLSIIQRD